MDTTHKAAEPVKIPGLLFGNDEATAQQPPQPEVLDRPRQENNGGDIQETQSQLGKAHLLTILPSFQGLG